MKNKAITLLTTLLTTLLAYSVASACTPRHFMVLVKCDPQAQYGIPIAVNPGRIETDESLQQDEIAQQLAALDGQCATDETLTKIAATYYSKWHSTPKRFFLDGSLMFEAYSESRFQQLQANNRNLLSCDYEEFERVGDWLVVTETTRPYCLLGPWPNEGGSCPSIVFSQSRFVSYLLSNLNLLHLLYFLAYVVVSGAMVGFWMYVLPQQSARGLTINAVIAILLIPITLCSFVFPIVPFADVIGWIVLCFAVGALVNYAAHRMHLNRSPDH
jgi:hypothetical protein